MIINTNGIVLHTINYSETSVIATIYTQVAGRQSFMIRGVRKQKSKTAMSLLQPLSLVEVVAHKKENREIQNVSELNSSHQLSEIPYNVVKSSIAFFISEVLYKSIHEHEQNFFMFKFIEQHILFLDNTFDNCKQFHLYFLIQLSRYLGFFPAENFDEQNSVFDLREGVFQNHFPPYGEFTTGRISELIYKFSTTTVSTHHLIETTTAERKELLDALLDYYQLHVLNGAKINSHKVFEEVL